MATTNVPAFLAKLWTLVEDSETNHLICWDVNGTSFHIYDQAAFSRDVLPLYFKHNNIASFIRQLNMYGFRKVVSVDSGSLKIEKDDMEFSHQYFMRDHEELLEFIKRKVGTRTGAPDTTVIQGSDVNRVLNDVVQLQDNQDNMTTKLETMKSENEALWREVANLRQKHHKQQQIVNKLIQFLVSLVGRRGIPNPKRRMPLMISEAPEKRQRLSKPIEEQITTKYNVQSPTESPFTQSTNGGVQIHEVTEMSQPDELDIPDFTALENDDELLNSDSTRNLLNILSPITSTTTASSESSKPPVDPTIHVTNTLPQAIVQTVETQPTDKMSTIPVTSIKTEFQTDTANDILESSTESALALKERPAFCRSPSRPEVIDYVENVQTDLDSLRDVLSGSQYNFDSNALLGIFNPEYPLASESLLNLIDEDTGTSRLEATDIGNIIGNEVITYNSNDDLCQLFEELPAQNETAEETSVLDTPTLNIDKPFKITMEEVD